MSLIEKAIEKMRADSGAPVPRGVATARPLSAASRVDAPVPAVLADPVPQPAHSGKKIVLDRNALRGVAYFPEAGSESRFANYYRQIKRPILHRAFAPGAPGDARLVMLSSALPSDGKTFNSLNLALSMARERDTSVLLVDADVPKPKISNVLGIAGERGLLDAVVNETLDPESLVIRTDIRGLELLASGTPADNASELLTSARMKQIGARLLSSNPRRIVLFDAPPLLVSSEARALLTLPGQIVLVVRAGKTPRRAVQDALDLVEEEKLTGLILNDGYGGLSDSYYNGYASYDSENNKKTSAE
jgi:protein-tyrosine kinase